MKIQMSFDDENEDDMESFKLMLKARDMKMFISNLRSHIRSKLKHDDSLPEDACKELSLLRIFMFELLSDYDLEGITS